MLRKKTGKRLPIKKITRLILKLTLIFSGAFLILSSFFSIDLLKINYIYIYSEREINVDGVITESQKNIYLINIDKIKALITSNNPNIGRVDVKKNFFGSLSIYITFRKPIAIAIDGVLTEEVKQQDASASAEISYGFERKGDQEYFIDMDAFLFNKEGDKDFPVVGLDLQNKKTGDSIDAPAVKFMLTVANNLRENGEIPIWIVNKDNKVVLMLPDGSFIILDSSKSPDFQLSSLQLIRNRFRIEGRKFEYLDLRFQKPVVKYLNE